MSVKVHVVTAGRGWGGTEVLEEGPQKGGGRPLGWECALEGMGKICRKRAGWER